VEGEPVTEHDVLTGLRLRLFTLADELGIVSAACRAMGVDRSTYYRLKKRVDRWGLEALNVRERRRPRMLNQIGPHLEQRIIAFALGHPGYGPRRISAELALPKWGGIMISEHGVWRVLRRVGLNTRAKRLALIARHRDPYERKPDTAPPDRHIDASQPGAKVQLDCFSVGRLSGTKGTVLAVHRHRRRVGLHVGRAARQRAQPALTAYHGAAAPRRPRARGRRLEAPGGHH
jgi:transposase